MKIIEKKDNAIIFKTEIEDSLVNAIRRYVNHVPVFAIDEVEIMKNDSSLYDETIAHRMGMIPLKIEKVLGKKNPKIKLSSKSEGFVYSKEIKGEAEPVYGDIPLTYLNKGQEIEIAGEIKQGLGLEHAKFSPGLIFYRNVSEVIMDKEFLGEVKSVFPNLEIKEKGNKIIIIDDKKQEIADVCEQICNKHGKKAEINPKDEIIITSESFGQMKPNQVFEKAIDELKKDLKDFSKKIDKI
ncbi:MAG: DNA-directed RNA polymerase subunit D [archaeon]